ncbi:MAG: hypothetical protein HY327_00615 [Chloroflexi bacterium]|nr:hypothetical protein [Chloroflexota bacterium]
MSEISRRQFFSLIAVKATERAQGALVSAARAARAFDSSKAISCARCNVRFIPIATEGICPNCQQVESKQQDLIAQIKEVV